MDLINLGFYTCTCVHISPGPDIYKFIPISKHNSCIDCCIKLVIHLIVHNNFKSKILVNYQQHVHKMFIFLGPAQGGFRTTQKSSVPKSYILYQILCLPLTSILAINLYHARYHVNTYYFVYKRLTSQCSWTFVAEFIFT